MKKHVSFNQASQPYGDIVIATVHGTNKVKKYNGKDIFLDDGTEFVIELDNPTRLKYLVKIKINGDYISNSGLVLRPGEHSFLERYIDIDRKFRFETYNVSADRKELIEKNGLVELEFYKESFPITTWSWSYCNVPYVPPVKPWVEPYNPWITYTTGGSSSGNISTTHCYNSSVVSLPPADSQIETGRIEQGGQSDQNFQNTYGSFENYWSYRNEYKIWPASQKQAVINQDIRSYCSGCGRRKRQGENFCPKCGQKL